MKIVSSKPLTIFQPASSQVKAMYNSSQDANKYSEDFIDNLILCEDIERLFKLDPEYLKNHDPSSSRSSQDSTF